ncbi:MAG: right-handed parallel beta-helix repeat-containing protein, partial [Clostridia bacterium]|nr:right-handed parallel beta-helix repeat-containing protein [Clostridia bacterium]
AVADWATDAVTWAVGVGLITGKANGGAATLSPVDKAVRAEFATIIKRFKEADFEYKLVYNSPVLKSSFTEKPYARVENADIYVAVDGSDSNPGTKDKPLATFEAAKAKAREIKKAGKSAAVVAFKAGDYGSLNNVQFTSDDSNVTYCAYGDGDVYFTGGVFVKESDFVALNENEKALFKSEHVDSIKKVDLSGYKEASLFNSSSLLFNDNGFCTIARYPNMKNGVTETLEGNIVQQIPLPGHTHEELWEIAQTTGDQDLLKTLTDQKKVTALAHFKKQLDTYTSLEGVQICGNISKIWHADNLDIESYDKATGIISFKQSPHYGFVNYDENYASVFISGASVDLDAAGEYWYDAENKALYVYAPAGEYLMSYQDSFITMKKTNNIVFKKLNFRGTTDTTITLENCNGFTFDMCSLLCSGGTYGFWGDESINIKVTNSELAYFADEGLHIQSPTSEYAVEGYHPDSLVSDGLVIDNNSIHDIGMITVGVDTSGIRLCNTVKSQITHNEVYNSNRCAIRFDGCIKTDIAYNYFHHCMLNSADGGVVYGFRSLTQRDSNVRYNLFTDIPNRTGAQYAIYNDGAHAWNIYGNIFYGAATINVVLNGGRDNHVYENVCINTGKPKSSFMLYNSDMIDEELTEEIKIGPEGEVDATFHYLTHKPEEGEPYYELWRETWPLLYDFYLNFEDIDKGPQCIYYTINHIKNNYLFDMSCSIEENSIADKFGDYEGNKELTTDTNDYFVDPTNGDYSPIDPSAMPNNHFAEIGRY